MSTTNNNDRKVPWLQPLWERLLLAERESLKLGIVRDDLLAALLSGRLRVQGLF